MHDYLTPFELWARKSGLVTADVADNPAMRRGRLLEPVALQMLKEERPEWTVEPNPIPGGVIFRTPTYASPPPLTRWSSRIADAAWHK